MLTSFVKFSGYHDLAPTLRVGNRYVSYNRRT